MSEVTGISRTSIQRILKHYKWHPYKIQLLQELNEDNNDRRLQFCEIIVGKTVNSSSRISKCGVPCAKRRKYWARAHQDWLLPQWGNVLFSDESRLGLVSDGYRERVWRERGG
nr:unnamed protein product [Callosobruchus chinensis]